MANTYVDYTGDNSETDFIFNFDYLQNDHVKVKVNDVIVTNYSIVEVSANNVIRFDTAPASNASIRIYRDSRGDFSPLVDFVDGSVLTQVPLDQAYKHNLFVSQEASEGTGNELLNKKGGANYDAEGNKIINLGTPTDSTDAANKGYVDQTIDNSIALGGSPAIVSLGGYDVTAAVTGVTQSLANWTQDLESLEDRVEDVINVLDYIPTDKHADIEAGTSTYDASADIQLAINAAKNDKLFFPAGTYRIASTLEVTSSQGFSPNDTIDIQGEGAENTTIITDDDITALKIQDAGGHKGSLYDIGFLNDGNTYSGGGVVVFNNPNSIAVLVQDTFQFVIKNCRIQQFGVGIKLHNVAYWTEGTKIINTYLKWNKSGILLKRENATGATESYSHTLITQTNIQIPKDSGSSNWGDGITIEGVTGGTGPAELYNGYIQANLWTNDSVGTSANLGRYLLLTQKGRISNSHVNMVFERYGKIQLNDSTYFKNSFTFLSSLDPSQVILEDNNTDDNNKLRTAFRGNINLNSVNMSEANWQNSGQTASLIQGMAQNSTTAYQFGTGTGLSFPFVTSLNGQGNGFFFGTTPDTEDNVTWRFKVDHNGKVYPQYSTAWLEAGTGATTTGLESGSIKMRTDSSRSSDLAPLWVGIGPDTTAAPVQIVRAAVTASRPSSPAAIGQMFFDTTLNKPIWWDGSNWVDSSGATV